MLYLFPTKKRGSEVLRFISVLNRMLDALLTASGFVTRVVVIALPIMIFAGVVCRYAFHYSIPFVGEYGGYMMVILSVLAANVLLRDNAHISVDFIILKLPQKPKAWLTLVTDVITVCVVIGIIIATGKLTIDAFITASTSVILLTPMWAVYIIMPIGFSLMLIEFLRQLAISAKVAFSKA